MSRSSFLFELLFDSYVQEQLTLSHFIVISAGPGKERTPNGQVSKWESLSRHLLFTKREGGRWRIKRARMRRAPDLFFFFSPLLFKHLLTRA